MESEVMHQTHELQKAIVLLWDLLDGPPQMDNRFLLRQAIQRIEKVQDSLAMLVIQRKRDRQLAEFYGEAIPGE